MSWIDNTIAAISPLWALRRERAKVALTGLRHFEAASKGRRTETWRANMETAQAEISASLPLLRARGRDLYNNNVWYQKAIDVVTNNVVGNGIRPNISNKRAAKAFKAWSETTVCDYDGQLNFYGLQRLVMDTVGKSGEALVVRRQTGKGLRLQVLEGDWLDQGRNQLATPEEGKYIVDGVEFDSNGKRIAYYIFTTNPMQFRGISTRFAAEDVIHVYRVLRPGQVRGIPMGVSAFMKLRDFDLFEDAVLMRQQLANMWTAFVRDSVDSGISIGKANEDPLPDQLEPGMIERLPPGKDVTFSNPPAAEGYGPYSRSVLLGVSSAVGITYEAMTNDLSNVNFSSGRMGWIEMYRNIQKLQNEVMITQFCQGVWNWFNLWNTVLGGADIKTVEWICPKREMIDPAKEISAMVDEVRAGFLTWPQAVSMLGLDPDTQMENIAEWIKRIDALGLKLTTDGRAFPLKAGPMQEQPKKSQEQPKK